MPREPKYFTSKEDARDAFLKDVSEHRNNINKAFQLYGQQFCNITGADYDNVTRRVIAHDLSKCSEVVEMTGLLAYFYRFGSDELEIDSPRRKYLYQKSMLNHYHVNSNHPEYWIQIQDGKFVAMEMDPESVVECVLDWIAIGYSAEFLSAEVYWAKYRGGKLIHKSSEALIDKLIREFVRMRDNEGIK